MRDQMRDPIETVLGEAGQLVEAQAARLNVLRDRLADEDLAALAGVVAAVADDVEAFRARLDAVDGDRVLDAAQAFARRRGPWAFAAGGAAVGLLAWSTLRRFGRDDVEGRLAPDELETAAARAP